MTTPAAGAPPVPASAKAPEPTHPCVRCGRPVALEIALCEGCNPLGLEQPASSQVHGTVAVALVLAVVLLAVVGRLALSGVGPFRAEVVGVEPAGSGLLVRLSVANAGSKAGATTCRVTSAERRGSGGATIVQTPQVPPGEARQFTTTTDAFGADPLGLVITCQSE